MIIMILRYFLKFFSYFREEKRPFIIYACLSLIAAVLELAGVALTYPFIMRILSDSKTTDWGKSPFVIGIIIIMMFMLKNLFMIFYTYVQARYTNNFEIKIKCRFMKYFLGTTYQESSKVSLAEKGKIINFLVPNIMNNFIFRLLNLVVNVFIFCFLALCLIIKFPLATLISVAFGIILLLIQTGVFKKRLLNISKKMSETVLDANFATNDALINMKSVKLSNNEKYFYDNFRKYLIKHYENLRLNNFINAIPPYIIEPFAIILLFVLVAIVTYQNYMAPDKLVASLAFIGAAIFRLTPTISRIQVNINGLNSALPLVDEFISIYDKYNIKYVPEIESKDFAGFDNSIELKNINFGYTEENLVLKNINLIINKGEFIGIAGPSGAGKTTLVDIIAGLYKANSGKILIDGNIQEKPLKIGYVPQEFVLIRGNIRENVAFGNSVIDDEKVIDALKKAQLYNYIKDNFKEGIYANPFVDSTGLSQGQKQRLAIARALYSEPDILIMDEATSSLDTKTESEICKVLNELKGKTTIIVIAHRLSTLQNADKIINIKNSELSEIIDKQN